MSSAPAAGGAPASAAVDALLADGRIVSVRPLRPEDADLLLALHQEMSAESRRRRFFSAGTRMGERYVEHLCAGDPGVLGVVALLDERIVGVASTERCGADSGEIAMVVSESLHGLGVGTLLLEHLAAACRERGITRLTADVLADNHAMMQVLLDAGIDLTRTMESGVVHVEMSTAATARAVAAADERECRAEARSLARLLSPHSVAIVGVRRDGTGAGAAVLRAVREGGYAGTVVVIHPSATEIDGTAAYPSLRAAPTSPDVVVVTVPAKQVEQVLDEAVAVGAGAAVVVTTELGEPDEAAATHERILRHARGHSLRLVGPNCLGLLTGTGAHRLNATFGRVLPRDGGLALASQSGGVGIVVLDRALRTGVGVHAFVSLGNKLDVSGNDLLAAWYDDPEVTMAGLYLESFGNPAKFLRLARRFSARKPLLAVRTASTASGRRAGAAHTAAVIGSTSGVEALFAQAGVVLCDDAEELAQAALLLDREPLPRGRRLGILTNAAGPGVLAADAAERRGLDVPRLSPGLAAQLCDLVPGVSAVNPVDVGPGPAPDEFAAARRALLASGEIDALLVVLVDTRITEGERLLASLGEPEGEEITQVLVPLGGIGTPPGTVTALPSVAAAVGALARVGEYAAWRAGSGDDGPGAPDPARAYAVRGLAERLLAGADSREVAERDCGDLLGPYGLGPTTVPVVSAGADAPAGRDPVDLAIGLARDPALGPLVTVSFAGVPGAIWRDPVVLVPPLSRRDTLAVVRRLETWPLLGVLLCGEADDHDRLPAALAGILVALSDIAVELPQVAALHLDPVRVTAAGPVVRGVRVRLTRVGRPVIEAPSLSG